MNWTCDDTWWSWVPHSLDAWTPQPYTNFIFQAVIGGPHSIACSPISPKLHETHWNPWKVEEPKYAKIKLANIPLTHHLSSILSKKNLGMARWYPLLVHQWRWNRPESLCQRKKGLKGVRWEHTMNSCEFPSWHGTHCDMNVLFASDDLMVLGEPCQRHR